MRSALAIALSILAPLLGIIAAAGAHAQRCRRVNLDVCKRRVYSDCVLVRRIFFTKMVWPDAPDPDMRVCVETCERRHPW